MFPLSDYSNQMPRSNAVNEQVRQRQIFPQVHTLNQHFLHHRFGSPNNNCELSPPSSIVSTSPSIINYGGIIQSPIQLSPVQQQPPQHCQLQLQQHQQPQSPLSPTGSAHSVISAPATSASSSATNSTRRNRRGLSKRRRTIFTKEQLDFLEREFANQMYLVEEHRLYITRALNLTDNQVKVWFQNRRIKFRRLQKS